VTGTSALGAILESRPDLDRARLYDPSALVTAAGWSTWSGHRVRQSVLWHLSARPEASHLPKAKRPEIAALSGVASVPDAQQVAAHLAVLMTPQAIASAREVFAKSRVHEVLTLLATTVQLDDRALWDAHVALRELSPWRAQAVAALSTTLGQDAFEDACVQVALSYVLQTLGWSQLPEQTRQRQEAATHLAWARVHYATRQLSDDQLYALVRALGADPARGAFNAIQQAARAGMPEFLAAFANWR
jgi:hypothetical protein